VETIQAAPRRRFGLGALVVALLVILFFARSVASFVIEYQWWREMNQIETWYTRIAYGYFTVPVTTLVFFLALWISHARGLKHGGSGLRANPRYARLSTIVLLALSWFLASATMDSDTVMRFFAGVGLPTQGQWRDPYFHHPLKFYFFHIPFYKDLLSALLAISFASAVVHWLAAHYGRLRSMYDDAALGQSVSFDISSLNPAQALESFLFKLAAVLFLVTLAFRYYLQRYDLLLAEHGAIVGIDWTAENITLPLLWACIAACILAGAAVLANRVKLALILPLSMLLLAVVPSLVYSVYVRPSEITIQRPYIQTHIEATRAAFGFDKRLTETEYAGKLEAKIDPAQHKQVLDNVRLWDWRAFHDTITQIQALRPYYVFPDTDVDRYRIDGRLRQILISPRELDVTQLSADARGRWINPHFIYTHGYGMVASEAARISQDGLPSLLVQDAPPHVKTNSLTLTRPEIYYGEVTHEPVFVRTGQPEFNYPSGSGNVESRYEGRGGFPISSAMLRLAASLTYGDWNIILTSYLKPESRMMIRRKVRDRLDELAPFIDWDSDPYLVITDKGRLSWTVDGYTSSNSHPYSRSVGSRRAGRVNYIRNTVKATVDAYDGTTRLYVFDPSDPIISAYRRLFPKLFTDASQMPADVRAHVRYPEALFRIQSEIYRTYHMTDPEVFFNKEDLWDFSRTTASADGRVDTVAPTYILAALPGSDEPEFLLITTFTPRNKDNLIGVMVARCDGERLGELVVLQLSKQELIFGPMQIQARINQDQTISKDLTLWNQQGSSVLRGQMLVLPIEDSLLYIEPFYLQSSEARMPQLKKIVMAMGNRLIYTDTYEQALSELAGQSVTLSPTAQAESAQPATLATPTKDPRLDEIRDRLRRYRELLGQGRYSDAGREVEAIERLLATAPSR
jgi:hypothetical protein